MPATNAKSSAVSSAGPNQLEITEILHAPRELTFRTWTDPVHVAEWWGPAGYTSTVREWDARPGGLIRIDMTAPDGTPFPMRGIFHEVIAPEWMDFTTTAFADAEGSDQLQVRHNVTFEDHNGGTKLTLRSRMIRTTAATEPFLDGMAEGWNQSFDRLAQLLATM